MAQRSIAAGSKVDAVLYPGATHGFDDPGRSHQSIPGNRSALEDVTEARDRIRGENKGLAARKDVTAFIFRPSRVLRRNWEKSPDCASFHPAMAR